MSLRTRNKVSTEFSMASMTDIIFLLLIFFIIVSTLVSPNALKVKLPHSSSKTTGKQTVSITIQENLNHYINGRYTAVDEIEFRLKELVRGQKEPGIILHADKSVPVEYAVKVMDIAHRNKYQLVLATTPEK